MSTFIVSADVSRRFWSKVDKSGECWLWRAGVSSRGYGNFSINDKSYRAHRVAWTIAHGSLDPSILCLHRCDRPLCVRPDHLFLGTHKDNMLDMAIKKRSASGDRNGARLHPETRPKGDTHHASQLSDDEVREILTTYNSRPYWGAQTDIASKYGIQVAIVNNIIRRKTGRHIGSYEPHRILVRLSLVQKAEIKAKYASGKYSQRAIAALFGLSQSGISKVVRS